MDLCQNTDINLDYKQSYNTQAKEQMFTQLIEDQAKFINYSIGDLYNYKAYINHGKLLETLYYKDRTRRIFRV